MIIKGVTLILILILNLKLYIGMRKNNIYIQYSWQNYEYTRVQ